VDPSLYSIGEKHYSSHVTCGGFTFRLLVLPAGTAPMKGSQVSAFLVVNPSDIIEKCATFHSMSCEISIVNWLDSKRSVKKRDRWSFCGFGLDRGWHDMLATKSLTREEGWLSSGGLLCVRARVTRAEPTRAMRHGMLVQWLHTLHARLSRRADEPDEAEVLSALLLHGDLPRDMPAELTCPLYSSTLTSRRLALERVKTLIREYPAIVAAAREDLTSAAPVESGGASFCPAPARGRPSTVLSSVLCALSPKPAAQGCAARLLLLMRADPNAASPGQGFTALHCCSMLASQDPSAAVAALVGAGADLEARDAVHGMTPLAWSAREGAVKAAEALLAHGAKCHARDAVGETPVELASRFGHAEVVSVLTAAAASAAMLDGADAIHSSARPGQEASVQPMHSFQWPLVRQLEARARSQAACRVQTIARWIAQHWRITLPREAAALIASGCIDFPLWPAATTPIVPPCY